MDSNHNLNLSSTSSANVITLDGQLRQFPIPLTVSQLLQQIDSVSVSVSESENFICNSDGLYYDEHIQAMEPTEELLSGQIYFVLPKSKLQYPLSASDMAALAVKASTAISSINKNNQRSSKSQIAPIDLSIQSPISQAAAKKNYTSEKQAGSGLGISRCGSMRKIQRYSTRRAKLAARSFRRLTTIHEVSDLQAY